MNITLDSSQMDEKELRLHTKPGQIPKPTLSNPDKSMTCLVHGLSFSEIDDPSKASKSLENNLSMEGDKTRFKISRAGDAKGLLSKHKKKST